MSGVILNVLRVYEDIVKIGNIKYVKVLAEDLIDVYLKRRGCVR